MSLLFFAGIGLVYAEDLSVSSNVRGASIAINGEDTGFKTPAVLGGISPGSVEVEVFDACRRGKARVEVAAGLTNRVSVDIEEELAQLTVQVTPAQAVVDVNNGKVKLSPNIPVGLTCGTYEIKAELKGYSTVSYTLELTGGQELTLPIELDRLGVSTVEVSVSPATATILFDGKEVGRDAVSMPSVYEGEHTLSAELKGYNPVEALIVVSDGDDLVFGIELGRGDNDSEVTGVGGAGRAALAEGAARKMAAAPTTAKTTKPDDKSDKLASLPEEDEDDEDLQADMKAVATPAKPAKVAELEEDEDEVLEADEPDDGVDNLDEVPDEAAVPKSWSEMHAEESKAKPEKTAKAEKSVSSSSKSTATKSGSSEKSSKTGMRVTGGVLMGLGAIIGGGGGYYTYTQAGAAYEIYAGKDEAAQAASGNEQTRLEEQALAYYEDEFAPRANLMTGAFVVGGVLAGTGLLLLVLDADTPVVVPLPDGALMTWATRF